MTRLATHKKDAFIRTRIEKRVKKQAEEILDVLGITPTQAINMLYKKIIRDHEWPLELKIPNKETLQAMEEVEKGVGLIKSDSTEEMFKKLGI